MRPVKRASLVNARAVSPPGGVRRDSVRDVEDVEPEVGAAAIQKSPPSKLTSFSAHPTSRRENPARLIDDAV